MRCDLTTQQCRAPDRKSMLVSFAYADFVVGCRSFQRARLSAASTAALAHRMANAVALEAGAVQTASSRRAMSLSRAQVLLSFNASELLAQDECDNDAGRQCSSHSFAPELFCDVSSMRS
jgi:hypothetical protein